MRAIYGNEQIGDPKYAGFDLAGILSITGADTFDKADYPGLRAIRIGDTITLAEDLPTSLAVAPPGAMPAEILSDYLSPGTTTITTTETVEATGTVTIPASWTGYTLEALYCGDVVETGTLTGVRTVTLRLRRTNVSGTVLSDSDTHIDTVPPNRYRVALLGFDTGETATGAQSIVLTSSIPADTGQVSITQNTMVVRAIRTITPALSIELLY